MNWKMQWFKLHFDIPVRKRTWRKLSAQLKHDVSLEFALNSMQARYAAKKSTLAKVFQFVLTRIYQGFSLDTALQDLIPVEEQMLIRGGYLSGKLPESLQLCVEIIEARQSIVGALIAAIAYPLVLLTVFIVTLVIMSIHVMPALSTISNPDSWVGAGAILYQISSTIASPWGVICLALLIILLLVILASLSLWTGKTRLWVENIPPWSIYRLVIGTLWLFSVATLLKADIKLSFILDDMLATKLSPWLRERVEAIRRQYSMGKNLGQVLADTGLQFPDAEMVDDLVIYANLPDFHKHLHTMAGEWLRMGTERIQAQAKILNGVLLIAIFGMMACIALAVVSIQQQLTVNLGGF